MADASALVMRPDMVVLGKGLSAGLCKHSAVLCRRALLPTREPTPAITKAAAANAAAIAAEASRKADLHLAAVLMAGTRSTSPPLGAASPKAARSPDATAEEGKSKDPHAQSAPSAASAVLPRPVEPCALCCAVALACLESASPPLVAKRAAELAALMERLSIAASGWLLPVRGRGYSYEFELQVTSAIASDVVAAAVCGLTLLYVWLWKGVLLLPRPLRSPRRFHAELSIHVTDEQVIADHCALTAMPSDGR